MVGCAKRKGRRTEGRGLYLRGSLEAALCGSHFSFLGSSEDLTFLGEWASRPRKSSWEWLYIGGAGKGRIRGARES